MVKNSDTSYEIAKTNETLHEELEGVQINLPASSVLTNEDKVKILHEEMAEERSDVEFVYKKCEEIVECL